MRLDSLDVAMALAFSGSVAAPFRRAVMAAEEDLVRAGLGGDTKGRPAEDDAVRRHLAGVEIGLARALAAGGEQDRQA